ncbi:hypothetical protein BJY01DRAFT_254324 [Aspergillus pseudoustus]|uniref:Uncharacterized protein n=1 Tax=Aspergillus pseudoustus TaxID=1810923 RepID=A0ABR4IWW1_9EURO
MGNQSLLERLSTELIQAILSELSDIQSLESAVLTGPCLYAAFRGAESQIVKSVLFQQFDADLLHNALSAEVSMQRSTWQESDVREFLDSYLSLNKQTFHSVLNYTLSQALRLARLLVLIDRFTRDLIAPVLARNKPLDDRHAEPPSPALPLSQTESNRFVRTFYRFQIYCSLFGDPITCPYQDGPERGLVFFAHFSAWENEQLACIHDYLLRVMAPVFRQEAETDAEWIMYFILSDTGEDSIVQQYHLSRGLNHIQRFLDADSPEERHSLLSDKQNRKSHMAFFSDILRDINEFEQSEPLKDLTAAEEQELVRQPLYSDPDTGPELVWRWAHQNQECSQFVFSLSQAPLREWAYVMWDQQRLEGWGVFERPWAFMDADACLNQWVARKEDERLALEERAKRLKIRSLWI